MSSRGSTIRVDGQFVQQLVRPHSGERQRINDRRAWPRASAAQSNPSFGERRRSRRGRCSTYATTASGGTSATFASATKCLRAHRALVTPMSGHRDFPSARAIRASFALLPTRPLDSAILFFEPDHSQLPGASLRLWPRARSRTSRLRCSAATFRSRTGSWCSGRTRRPPRHRARLSLAV